MPRDGRALELLMARLEAVASGGNAEVRSPEFFPDTDSGTPREVDVTVRTKAGSADVLVMFECRDRAGDQDVRWMDEIAGKRAAIGADIAVAVVGTGGFTGGARRAAAARGIQLRTVEDVTVGDVAWWCSLGEITVETFETRNQSVDVAAFSNSPPLADLALNPLTGTAAFSTDQPVFAIWRPGSGVPIDEVELLSANQLHRLATHFYFRNDDMRKYPKWTPVTFVLSTQDDPSVCVRTKDGHLFPLAHVNMLCDARMVTRQVPVRLRFVTDSKGVVTQVAEAIADENNISVTLSFIRTDDGRVTVTLQPEQRMRGPTASRQQDR